MSMKNLLPIRSTATPEGAALSGIAPSPDSRLQSGYALLPSRIRRPCLILINASVSC
jgi:hypothetical protein